MNEKNKYFRVNISLGQFYTSELLKLANKRKIRHTTLAAQIVKQYLAENKQDE